MKQKMYFGLGIIDFGAYQLKNLMSAMNSAAPPLSHRRVLLSCSDFGHVRLGFGLSHGFCLGLRLLHHIPLKSLVPLEHHQSVVQLPFQGGEKMVEVGRSW